MPPLRPFRVGTARPQLVLPDEVRDRQTDTQNDTRSGDRVEADDADPEPPDADRTR